MERAGIATMLCNDFEEACVKTLVTNWGESRVDSRSIADTTLWQRAEELGAVDVVSGGFPCQSFSIAGAQQGFDDPERGEKFFDMMSFVDALIEPPKVLFLENVPSLKTHNGGQWLADILTALKKRGFWISQKQCLLLNSQAVVGSAQSRERLFIIAYHQAYFKKYA
jgi:DNA (cytosine-5)-methyltransferase 1